MAALEEAKKTTPAAAEEADLRDMKRMCEEIASHAECVQDPDEVRCEGRFDEFKGARFPITDANGTPLAVGDWVFTTVFAWQIISIEANGKLRIARTNQQGVYEESLRNADRLTLWARAGSKRAVYLHNEHFDD